MKKSKLLMPLTGIAAIGAIAPVAVMTACHKNEYKLIASNKCGNVIDGNTECMTNRLGYESLMDSETAAKEKATVSFAARLVKPVAEFTRGHIVKVSAKLTGETGKTGTPFIIEEFNNETIVDEETDNDTLVWEDDIEITINKDKMVELYKAEKDEEFKFTLVYEEFDSDKADAKSVGKQNVEYSLVACPAKHDVTVIDNDAMTLAGTPDDTIKTNINIGGKAGILGWDAFLTEDALQDLTITMTSDKLELNDADKKATLTIASGQVLEVAAESSVPEKYLLGTVGEALTKTTQFLGEKGAYIVFTIKTKAANENYVVDSWTSSYELGDDTGITVTVA